jgi:hypothetical protein
MSHTRRTCRLVTVEPAPARRPPPPPLCTLCWRAAFARAGSSCGGASVPRRLTCPVSVVPVALAGRQPCRCPAAAAAVGQGPRGACGGHGRRGVGRPGIRCQQRGAGAGRPRACCKALGHSARSGWHACAAVQLSACASVGALARTTDPSADRAFMSPSPPSPPPYFPRPPFCCPMRS